MKTGWIAGFISTALIGSVAHAGKVLEYRFEDRSLVHATDTSGNDMHGQLRGSDIHYALSQPGHGFAIALNGVDDFINAGDQPPLDIHNYTLMAWVKYIGNTKHEIMEKGGSYWMNILVDSKLVRAGGFYRVCNVPVERWQNTDSAVPVIEGSWTHVASTFNGLKLKIFVDGQLVKTEAILGPTCKNDVPLAIGAKYVPHKNVTKNFLNGFMDDVRVYNNALTGAQIRQVMLLP